MHIVQAINKIFENKGIYTAKDKDNNMYRIYKSDADDGEYLRITKNGMVIEIPFDINFRQGFHPK